MLRAMIVGAATVFWLATAASAANYKVMIATWRGCEEACQGFQDYLKERGVDADVILRDAGQATEALPGILAEARSEGVDLIFSWGPSVTLGFGGTLRQPADPTRNQERKSGV